MWGLYQHGGMYLGNIIRFLPVLASQISMYKDHSSRSARLRLFFLAITVKGPTSLSLDCMINLLWASGGVRKAWVIGGRQGHTKGTLAQHVQQHYSSMSPSLSFWDFHEFFLFFCEGEPLISRNWTSLALRDFAT
jgi:hypothetical protein